MDEVCSSLFHIDVFRIGRDENIYVMHSLFRVYLQDLNELFNTESS